MKNTKNTPLYWARWAAAAATVTAAADAAAAAADAATTPAAAAAATAISRDARRKGQSDSGILRTFVARPPSPTLTLPIQPLLCTTQPYKAQR